MLMVRIDKILTKTKKARITKIYDDKVDDMEGKIRAAKKEFILKNVESGNREVEELTKQIEVLNESNTQTVIAHGNIVNRLNEQLRDANKLNQTMKDFAPKRKEYIEKAPQNNDKYIAEINMLANGILTASETKQITSIKIGLDGYLVLKKSDITQSLINKLIDIRVLEIENERYKVTNHGKMYIDSIKKNNLK
jgi:NCAIR mutase (PurE)-related protein